jgi:putative component of toxin-antitoxin plasmid stabilization module
MKTSLRHSVGVVSAVRLAVPSQQGGTRVIVLVLVCLLLGAVGGAYWGIQRGRGAADGVGEPVIEVAAVDGLSATSQRVVAQLTAPVELRLHAVLGDSQAAEPWLAFAARVEHLLKAFEQAGEGRITVVRLSATPEAKARAAALADGLELFNLGRTEVFCGIEVISGQQRAVLPRLSPDWEAALEMDVCRALARVSGGPVSGGVVVNPTVLDAAVVDEVKAALPDLATLSVEEGKTKLRAAAVEEFKAAVEKMNAEMAKLQERLARANASGDAGDVEAARKAILELQTEQAEAMSQISRRTQARITTLEQLKGGGQP